MRKRLSALFSEVKEALRDKRTYYKFGDRVRVKSGFFEGATGHVHDRCVLSSWAYTVKLDKPFERFKTFAGYELEREE